MKNINTSPISDRLDSSMTPEEANHGSEEQHWERHWLEDGGDSEQHANTLYGQQELLIEMVATGDVDEVAKRYPNEFASLPFDDRPRTAGGAAYELYLKMGPDSLLGGGGGLLGAIAGRILNEAVGEEVVQAHAFMHDFFEGSDRPNTSMSIAETSRQLLLALQPNNEHVKQLLDDAAPDQLVKVADILVDAQYIAGDRRIQGAMRASVRLLLEHILESHDARQEDLVTANNLKYDLLFADAAERWTTSEQSRSLMRSYAANTLQFVRNMNNGSALEAVAPLMTRFSAWEVGELNAIEVRHAAQRSDSPHDLRLGRTMDRRSSDFQIVHRDTNSVERIQLKADGSNGETGEYNESVVRLFDGGISRVANLGAVRVPSEARMQLLNIYNIDAAEAFNEMLAEYSTESNE